MAKAGAVQRGSHAGGAAADNDDFVRLRRKVLRHTPTHVHKRKTVVTNTRRGAAGSEWRHPLEERSGQHQK